MNGEKTRKTFSQNCFKPFNAATIVVGTLLAITRRPLQLERCSSPLRIQ